ncbi:MAG: lecithin retinol acyltransferase family protein [Clostridia bacterium]
MHKENQATTDISQFFAGNIEPEIGDHLYVIMKRYIHHGLYIGDGKVIHYLQSRVSEDTLSIFAKTAKIRIYPIADSPVEFDAEQIIERAKSRISENNFQKFGTDCEKFVRWSRCDQC